MYSLEDYGAMIADVTRTDAYREALGRVIRPGAVVVDIGCGSGIFSFLACKAGAGRVYAIEASETIALARQIAAANGFADRIEFIAGDSTRISLPQPADVVVSDVRGVMPQLGRSLALVIDARKRFLRPGGILIPRRDTVWGALMIAPKPYEDLLLPWSSKRYGINFDAARSVALNSIHSLTLKPAQIGGVPQRWCVLDYATIENPSTSATITFEVAQPMTAFGCCFWFDTILFEEIEYTTAPGRPDSVYGGGFFPWPEPVKLEERNRVCFELRADLVGEGYVWSWKTRISEGAAPDSKPRDARPPDTAPGDATGHAETSGKPAKISFAQSSFLGTPLRPERLRCRSGDHVPVLGEEGEMDRFLLDRMDSHTSLEEIARAFAARFSAKCARWEDALDRAARVAEKYGR